MGELDLGLESRVCRHTAVNATSRFDWYVQGMTGMEIDCTTSNTS